MKPARWTTIITTLMVGLGLSALAAWAADPTANDPEHAPYLDMETHTLAAHAHTWYRFEFAVDHPSFLCRFFACPDRVTYHAQVAIKLLGAVKSGLQFAVFAPDQIRNWRSQDPVGRGNPEGDDLTWAGSEDGNGTWYVQVSNDTNNAIAYRFALVGAGVILSRRSDAATPQTDTPLSDLLEAARRPTVTPTPVTALNNDPNRAVPLDNNAHTIAARSELWYTVGFPRAGERVAVKLLDGAGRGVTFEVYAPGQIGNWWKEDPLGRGNVDGNDLIWSGDPDVTDIRYLRVVNNSDRALSLQFLVETRGTPPEKRPLSPP